MESVYVDHTDGKYTVAGTRISLDSIIYAFLEGLSPETIASECFPSLTLEQVYGGITYYLAHREDLDAYLKQGAKEFTAFTDTTKSADPSFYQRLAKARRNADVGQ